MYEFAAKRLPARSSWLVGSVVRCASWIVPLSQLIERDLTTAKTFALFMGMADGWVRLLAAQTARSLVAEREGLLISSAFQTSRIPWPNVLAVQTTSFPGGVEYVTVHYRTAAGGCVATCWEQHDHAELVAFIRACASQVNRGSQRQGITLFGLHERGVWWPIVRRAMQDVGVAAGFALLLRPALLLGVITAGVSALIACSRYPPWTRRFILKDGSWFRETKRRAQQRSTIPRSLRMWADALRGYGPRG
jgi:hypothetical protein